MRLIAERFDGMPSTPKVLLARIHDIMEWIWKRSNHVLISQRTKVFSALSQRRHLRKVYQ